MAFLGQVVVDLDRATSFGPKLLGIETLIVMAPPVSRYRSAARSRITWNSIAGKGIANCGVSFKSQNLTVCKPKTPLECAIARHKVVVSQGDQNGENGAVGSPKWNANSARPSPSLGPASVLRKRRALSIAGML